MKREFEPTGTGILGGEVAPLSVEETARRAYFYASNPLRNPLKEVQDAFDSVAGTPPVFGIFNDIPWNKIREDEVAAWANAGFTFIITDGEHSLDAGRMGREQAAMLARFGLIAVQRLHREARSEHGDALAAGCRATMRPYGRTLADASTYLDCCRYPVPGAATENSRGGFPMRKGNREMYFTPGSLREAESETQAWVQFETLEYIVAGEARTAVLDAMAAEGRNKSCGFLGPFDALLTAGAGVDGVTAPDLNPDITTLVAEASAKGVHMGRVCGSGTCSELDQIEESMVTAIKEGFRIISSHYLTSDLPFHGAKTVAIPFFKACKRCGF